MTTNGKVNGSAELLPPDVPPPSKVPAPTAHISSDPNHGLKSNWPVALDLAGGALPCRLEGEVEDLVIFGSIPKEIDGIFYRVMVDPFVPPDPKNVPLDGDGNICAFQIRNGKVDMKTKYIETQRFKLERKANKALFGLYRNPFTHHPCVRAAVDSTANTNLVYWAGVLLALKEVALPYGVDPTTLETTKYDPLDTVKKIKSKTFTAHPKYDPYNDQLVVFGYEAKGLASTDVVTYTIDRSGEIGNEFWVQQPYSKPGFIHDCAITPNWLVLFIWPFDADLERMKAGGHHWGWTYERAVTFIVVPRNASSPPASSGWKAGEYRSYDWKNCMPIHTAAAWEDADGNIFVESSRVHDNAFPFFPPKDGRMPAPDTKADFVRWKIDPRLPDRSSIADPQVILDVPAEFPRIDERFMTKEYDYVWLNVFVPSRSDGNKNIFHGLNGLAQHSHKTGKTEYFYAGDDSLIQEPIFIPRSDSAPEGDGWIMAMAERLKENRCDVVVVDTRDFEKPIAIVQLPFHVKSQVHGNWVSSKALGGYKPMIKPIPDFEMIKMGALEPF